MRLTHDGKYAIWVEGLSLKVSGQFTVCMGIGGGGGDLGLILMILYLFALVTNQVMNYLKKLRVKEKNATY